MRLLDTTLTTPSSPIPAMREFIDSQIPPYAILSHTWTDDEVTLQDLLHAATATTTTPSPLPFPSSGTNATTTTSTNPLATLQRTAGFRKIHQTCALARTRDNLAYAWVDTCCIDKRSSAELAEAINSMYAWYRDAAVCYVYLADLAPAFGDADGGRARLATELPACRWFTRGWTLQELIAPREVVFLDREWNYRGSKAELAGLLGRITGIPEGLLRQEAEPCDFAVARRMSWAAGRETTRVEDMAYCLLGIFDVHMSLIYGEGAKAFARLQEMIVQTTADLSIFVWTEDRASCADFAGVLATSPRQFAQCGDVENVPGDSVYANFAVTTRGLQTEASLIHFTRERDDASRVVLDARCYLGARLVGVPLRKIGGGLYARYRPNKVLGLDKRLCLRQPLETLTLTTKLPRRFPFYQSPHPVVGNRYSALRVKWGPFAVAGARAKPRSHWDVHDEVIFSCNAMTNGWGAHFVNDLVVVSEGSIELASVNLFLACFHWNVGTPSILIAILNDVDATTAMLLESQLDHVKFEGSSQAHRLVRSVLTGKATETATAHKSGSATYEVSYWDSAKGSVSFNNSSARITVSLEQEDLPEICGNPVTVLKVGFTHK